MHKSLYTVVLIALWLGVSSLVKADPFGTSIKYPGIPCLIIGEVQVDGANDARPVQREGGKPLMQPAETVEARAIAQGVQVVVKEDEGGGGG